MIGIAAAALLAQTVTLTGQQFSAPRVVFSCVPSADLENGWWWIDFQNDATDRYIRIRGDGRKYGKNAHLDVTLENPFKQVDRQDDNGAITWSAKLVGTATLKPVTIDLVMRQKSQNDLAVAEFTAKANGVIYTAKGCIVAPTFPSPRTAEFPK